MTQNGFQPLILALSDREYVWGTWEESDMTLLPSTSSPPHLLLIEPDAGLRTFLEVALREEGYRLRVVSSLKEAVALVSMQAFDLVLADLSNESSQKQSQALKPLQGGLQPLKVAHDYEREGCARGS